VKITAEVASILDRCQCRENKLFLPPEQLDRRVYIEVNKVLQAMGGKWNGGKVRAHVFDDDPASAVSDAIASGQVTDRKQELQFFQTPPKVAALLVSVADVKKDHRILEPSAGGGAIVRSIFERLGRVQVNVCEIDEKNRQRLIKEFDDAVFVAAFDFLNLSPLNVGYDRIIANPPFSRQQDIDHVTHMYECLEPGGRLVSVMSAAVMFRTNRKTVDFRELVEREGGAIEPLPEGSFKSSGTDVNTCVVRIDKGVTV
jgi:predicted RNA methylase